MKLSVIGGGSTYTPELVEGVISLQKKLNLSSLYLMDIDSTRLEIVGNLAKRMVDASKSPFEVILSCDLNETLKDSDIVITQIRVAGSQSRLIDEEIAFKCGCIAQETTGGGGFSKALRTIPVIIDIAKKMELLCPNAWLINFTNPAGIITEAVYRHGRKKVVGLCNVPIVMKSKIAEYLKIDANDLEIDYFGLNHLSWIRRIFHKGIEITPDIIKNAGEFLEFSHLHKDSFPEKLIEKICLIPSPYLRYFYCPDKVLEEQRAEGLRAQKVREIETELLKIYQDKNLYKKPEILSQRGGALYSKAALDLIDALTGEEEKIQIINIPQENFIPGKDENTIVELPAKVSKDKIEPICISNIPEHAMGLMQIIKTYERLTIEAATEGSYDKAIQALLIHPLVGDYHKALNILEHILKEHKAYLPAFQNH